MLNIRNVASILILTQVEVVVHAVAEGQETGNHVEDGWWGALHQQMDWMSPEWHHTHELPKGSCQSSARRSAPAAQWAWAQEPGREEDGRRSSRPAPSGQHPWLRQWPAHH